MEVVLGWERDCRQEVRCEAERRRSGEAWRVDPLWEVLDAVADEGGHRFGGADVSDAGEGRSDGRFAEALDTSVVNIERT